VLIGCRVGSVAQFWQMLGRGCRSRGVCDGLLYVNTGDDEMTFLSKLKLIPYSEIIDYITFLKHLAKLQLNPTKCETVKTGKMSHKTTVLLPEVEALHYEWLSGNWLESINDI
jgi:type I site-specific restriction endonuclease